MKLQTLTNWLNYYTKTFPDTNIVLVSRPTEDNGWADRCIYQSDNYSPFKSYNHRTILPQEVIIEYDTDNKEDNKKYVDIIAKRLLDDGIEYIKWDTSNKSVHLHTLVDIKEAGNVQLLKKVFVRHYCEGLPVPDLRLCVDGHLVRAEYGVHEKTGKKKHIISRSSNYPVVSRIPQVIWNKYVEVQSIVVKRKTTMNVNELVEDERIKYFLNTHEFGKSDDGRERALFMLIHLFKPKYKGDKQGLVKFLQDWYKYSGGYKLKDKDIENKVRYHWSRDYHFGNTYINELLESIGRSDLIK